MSNIHIEHVKQHLKNVSPVIAKYCPDALNDFQNTLAEKEHQEHASIIVYGIYNHGKSTLINALLGSDQAEVANRPMTDKPCRYSWNEHVIIDTPGIDAPIEHTKIATAELHKAEIVIFVVESGSVELQNIWSEAVSMVQRNQRICIVINDCSNIIDDVHKLQSLKEKYYINIQQEADKQGVQDVLIKVPFFCINAKAALKAKKEGKNALLQHSKLPELEHQLEKLFASIPTNQNVITLQAELCRLIRLCSCSLPKPKASLRRIAEESFAQIKTVRQSVELKCHSHLDRNLEALRPQIREYFNSNPSQPPQDIILSLANAVTESLQTSLQDAQGQIEDICVQFDEIKTASISVQNVEDPQNADGTPLDMLNKLETVPWKELLNSIGWEQLVQDGIVKSLQLAKTLLPELFKGIGPVTMGRWASTFTKCLGPAVAVATVLYDVYSSYAEEEKARNKAERHARALEDAVTSFSSNLHAAFSGQIASIIMSVFDPLFKRFTQEFNLLDANEEEIQLQLYTLEQNLAALEKA